MWRNDEIADCAFAAAADWEMAALHHTPNEGQLIREFHKAGGSDGQGIEARRYEAWWDRHGIGGVRVHLRELHPTRREVERQLARGHPLIADMNLGDHTITVVGYDASGVSWVTYGETRHMTWREWHEDVYPYGQGGLYRPMLLFVPIPRR